MRVDVLSGASRSEGGLFYSVRWLSMALGRVDVDTRLVSHIDEYTAKDLPSWNTLPVELYRGYGPLLSSLKLRQILKNSTADLLHVHGIWLDRQWAAYQWQRKTGKSVVISPRGMLDPWAVNNAAWKKKLAGALFANESLRNASCIHALCESEVDSIRKYGLDTPVAVVPNGVELPLLKQPRGVKPRKKLLFLGRIHPKKGIAELIKGWARAKPSEWELLIAGWDDGGHEDGLRQLTRECGVEETISFLGPQYGNEKEVLLRSVDAFILPSLSEGLPMSVLEAWSYGLPVVMTRFCNIPIGFHVGAALMIEPNAESIFHVLEQLTSMSTETLFAMGSKGRKLVEEQFTWEHIASEMKEVYRWCLGGDKPACIQTI